VKTNNLIIFISCSLFTSLVFGAAEKAIKHNNPFNDYNKFEELIPLPERQKNSSFHNNKSRFGKESRKLQTRLGAILHPVLHGCAENQEKFFDSLKQATNALGKGDYSKAWEEAKKNTAAYQSLKVVGGSIVRKYVGKEAGRVLLDSGFYNESGDSPSSYGKGSRSLEALNAAKKEVKKRISHWDEKKICPEGFLHCRKLGHTSKTILTSMQAFFRNIKSAEDLAVENFFSTADTNRVFSFLDTIVRRICEENILSAITNEGSFAPDDSQLKPHLKVVNLLLSIPTKMHDTEKHWRKNKNKIDELLDFLPLEQQRNLYTSYMRKIQERSQDPKYGHHDGNSSINLLLSGPTGTGKTFVGKKLPQLLGFNPIIVSLDELRSGQEASYNELKDLIDYPEISGFEKKILLLNKKKKEGLMPLNPIIFVDEIDEDRNYSISELKDQFDQFKKIYLPSLGINIPGFMNCIFTTNNERFLKNPALISRFTEIKFPPMEANKKTTILLKSLNEKLAQFPKLKEQYGEVYFKNLVHQAVSFDKCINIRILMDNVDSIIYFVDTQNKLKNGDDYLVPAEDRNKTPESYDEFLQRTFGGLDFGDTSDSDSDSSSDLGKKNKRSRSGNYEKEEESDEE